jgi:RNA polymerase sigma-54 factor
MRPALEFRTRQHLALSPQLQQAIQLLQLPQIDLRGHLMEVLESNLMLEIEEPAEAPADERADAQTDEPDEPDPTADQSEGDWNAVSTASRDSQSNSGGIADLPDLVIAAPPPDLRQHLMEQLGLHDMPEAQSDLATAIIDAIDDDGYLTETLEELDAAMGAGLDPEQQERVLAKVQNLDPLGVGARNLTECLHIQLLALAADTPCLSLALALADEAGLELLARREWGKLAKRHGTDRECLETAAALIRCQNPRPGSTLPGGTAPFVTPDVFVQRVDGRWVVELNEGLVPKLRVNKAYADALRREREAAELRGQLQEARWLVRSLQLRNETLLRVASAIVDAQQGFLDDGEIAMRPMILRDIAEQVELHESTISRVTSGKYMHTPRGIYEFRYFFSSHLSTTDGGEQSATAIRAMIRGEISGEDPKRPLSDNGICKLLNEKGINVARRTVTKYREGMDIPSSTERRRLAR